MPPPLVSILWRRSEGLVNIQRLLRRSSAQACAVNTVNTEKTDAQLGSHGLAQVHRSMHAASSSSSSSSNSSTESNAAPSQDPLLDIAQSLEKRYKLLQQEHVDSQVLHRSSHVGHQRPVDSLHGDQGKLDQQHTEAQWARYHEHRAASDRYIAQRQVDLPEASLDINSSTDSVVGQRAQNDNECRGKMHQLKKLFDLPLSSMSGSMGLQERDADTGKRIRPEIFRLSKPDAPGVGARLAPSALQHGTLKSTAALGGVQGGRQADPVPIHSQQLLQTGIIGVPNSGKSTLTNALAGQKVTAVSDKTNTTGAARLGAFTKGNSQVALYDTPGVVHTRSLHGPRHARSVRSAWGTASQCDMLMCIVDAHRQILKPDVRVYGLVEELASGPLPSWNALPTILVLNKVDLLSKEQGVPLLHLRNRFLQIFPFESTFCVSARHGAGMQELRQYLLDRCQPGRWIVRSWEATDMGASEIATELVREKLFKRLYKEVPYNLEIVDASMRYLSDGSIRIEKDIMVPSEQIRGMVVGSKGSVIGEVGIAARQDLEAVLAKRVHLILNVRRSSH